MHKKIRSDKISLIGLGKLGMGLAACFAERGFKVIGVDINKKAVSLVNAGLPPNGENGLRELICKNKDRLKATSDHSNAISETDITFILVATPSDTYGNFSNAHVESAAKSLALALKKSRKPYHIFVLSSTVIPTSIDQRVIPIIERYSGRKVNKGFGFCHVPDFVALGSVIRDFMNPDFILIGQADEYAGSVVSGLYKRMCLNNAPIIRTSLVNAEIAKVALNNFITLKISFSNALANLCEKIPGADVDEVTQVIGHDKRISPHYLRGGLAFGGTCFPRDVAAGTAIFKKYGLSDHLQKAVRKINAFQDNRLLQMALAEVKKNRRKSVSVLGLAFKPGTSVIEMSPAIRLISGLLKRKIPVIVYDARAIPCTKELFGDRIGYADSMERCLSSSGVCVIATPDKDFQAIKQRYFAGKPTTVIDCWRIVRFCEYFENVNYIPFGVGRNKDANS